MSHQEAKALLRNLRELVSRQGGNPDGLVHYDLALAYLEMGMVQDSLSEVDAYVGHHFARLPASAQTVVEQLRVALQA